MNRVTLIKKIILALICTAMVVAWSALCKPPQVDIRAEAFAVLEQMHAAGVQRADFDIALMDQQMFDIADREEQLKQLLPQTEPWVEQKKLLEYGDVPCG
jgi:hypothetical protein